MADHFLVESIPTRVLTPKRRDFVIGMERRTLVARQIETAIIGAGPYGLSLAAHLRATDIPYEIYGRPMGSWRFNMPTDMTLRSEAFASSLWDPRRSFTFEAFCHDRDIPYQPSCRPLRLSRFLDYADWFQKRAVPDVREEHLLHLAQLEDRFKLEFSNGDEVLARNVVVATGHMPFRHLPLAFAKLSTDLVSHSADHKDLGRFRAKKVIVVGSGQSGLETAALLHEQGSDVRILARRSRLSWNPVPFERRSIFEVIGSPEAGIGTGWRSVAISELPQAFFMLPQTTRLRIVSESWGPSGAWWLKDRVASKIPVFTSHEIFSAHESNGKVNLVLQTGAQTVEMEADHIIAATGFRVNLARLYFLDSRLLARIEAFEGIPKLTRSFESTVPGLFFIGLVTALSFGPVMRVMFGAKHAAPALAQRLMVNVQTHRLVPIHEAAAD